MSGPYVPGSTQPLDIVCPNCGRPNAPGMTFCSQCGQRLAGAAARVPGAYPPQPPQQAQPYYPPQAPPYYQPAQQPPQPTYAMPPIAQTQYPTYAPSPYIAARLRKSLFLGFFLAFLFGPLGLFYSTVVGGLIMILVTVGAWALFFVLVVNRMDYYAPLSTDSGIPWVTLLSLGIWVAVWVISIIWAIVAVNSHNNKLQTPMVR